MSEKELESTKQHRCRECGADTRQGAYKVPIGAWVNRIPADVMINGVAIDCYICGMCEETFNECYSENYDSHLYWPNYDEYVEERNNEVDQIDPIAKLFRKLTNEK